MNNKPLMIILITLIFILILGLGGGIYLIYTNSELLNTSQKEIKKEISIKAKETYNANIDDLILNITNSRGRVKLMKLSFTLKSIESSISKIVEENKAELIDIVISLISQRSSEELHTLRGKEHLREELLEELNMQINKETISNKAVSRDIITKVLFTSFVIK